MKGICVPCIWLQYLCNNGSLSWLARSLARHRQCQPYKRKSLKYSFECVHYEHRRVNHWMNEREQEQGVRQFNTLWLSFVIILSSFLRWVVVLPWISFVSVRFCVCVRFGLRLARQEFNVFIKLHIKTTYLTLLTSKTRQGRQTSGDKTGASARHAVRDSNWPALLFAAH